MTPASLALIRQILAQVSIPASDPNFRTMATQMIQLLDELDDLERQGDSHAVNASRPALHDVTVP